MTIQKIQIKKIENSVAIMLPKEFLDSIGVSESDTIYNDEDKLKNAIVKKEIRSDQQKKLEMMIAKSVQKHDKLYKKLVDK